MKDSGVWQSTVDATSALRCTVQTLVKSGLKVIPEDEQYVNRVMNHPVSVQDYRAFVEIARCLGVTANFKEIIDYFKTPAGESPAGFRLEFVFDGAGVLRADLKRDISYDKNGIKRATQILYSADSANPYEVAPISKMIANLTCNPGIIYDLFLNNPKANVGNLFKNRDEVMEEIGRVLGPGADISVELNNPFAEESLLLEEAAHFSEMLSKYRVVIKVPHTGPVNSENVGELLTGDKKFKRAYNVGSTKDMFRGHNVALMLHEHGFRVNFTLMFEPHQAALALQARPYFINCFVRHRLSASESISKFLNDYAAQKNDKCLEQLRTFMIDKDYLSALDTGMDLSKVKSEAERIVEYRQVANHEGADGLDSVRHSLRVLRQANLPDTRLIICSMEGPKNYADLDKMLMEPEFKDMSDKVVITAEPQYLAQFTTTPQVISYQRRFMNAAKGQA
jgi:hypothetical protein